MRIIVNSKESLSSAFGAIRESWEKYRFVKIDIKEGKARSLSQNSLAHIWYEQLARELREDDAMGWKSYCKLHHGVPLLRSEDEEFRTFYDASIKPLTYEQKLSAMRFVPVTSLMTKPQLSAYLELVQNDFMGRGVMLEFPEESA